MVEIKNKTILLLAFLFLFVGFISSSNITGAAWWDRFNIFGYCGDGICKSPESEYSCPKDCKKICTPNWQCSTWSSCVNGQQTRTCEDLNKCGVSCNNDPNCITTKTCTSTCEYGQTNPCTANNGCSGTQKCSSGTFGTCITTLQKCLDGSCKTSCTQICTPNCNCVSNTCIGQTCSDGCNGLCQGTKTCGCIPDCTNRECGIDPKCGISCGICSVDKICNNGKCLTNNILPNLKGFYIINNQKQEVSMFSSAGYSNSLNINKLFLSDSVYPLSINKPIYSFSITGDISFTSDNSLVRVILLDNNQKEYLVYEGYPLIIADGLFKIENVCEETCVLNGVIPFSLKIQVIDGSININSITYSDSFEKLNSDVKSKGLTSYGNELKGKQNVFRINKINTRLKEKGMSWTAGETSVSKLTYTQKKALFSNPNKTPLEKLPNLQGFEYYKGGVFEIKSKNSAPSKFSSSFPLNWDWRNRHGENWLTSIKDQGGCGSCWAFGATGATEAVANLYFNRHLDLDLSEQDALSCSGAGTCFGGSPSSTLDYYKNVGVVNEACFPYNGIDANGCKYGECVFTPNLCSNKCQNWENSVLKISGKEDYIINEEGWLKEKLIKNGVLSGGIGSWGHAMALAGWETDYKKETIWIFKNSWGINFGEQGYARVKIPASDICYTSSIISPVIYGNQQINCVDKDNDNYCNWGLSETKPATCPQSCQPEKDCDDSNPSLGTFDVNFNCMSIGQCTNECNKKGDKECVSDNVFKICGNYDSDSCLEYQTLSCLSGEFCKNGNCCRTCSSLDYNCDKWDDNCGGKLFCGKCGYDETCKNGKCILTSCKDSDGGKNYYVKGNTCSGSGYICQEDWCKDKTLIEFYCGNKNTAILSEEHYCLCKDGACINKTCTTDECLYPSTKCYSNNSYQKCADYNNDGCYEWSEVYNCPPEQKCDEKIGKCISLISVGGTPLNQCTAGYKCYNTKYIGYQDANCKWNNIRYCAKGCSNNKCNSF